MMVSSPKHSKKAARVKLVCALDILTLSTACIKAFSKDIMLHLTFFTDKLTKHEISTILHLTLDRSKCLKMSNEANSWYDDFTENYQSSTV